MSYYQPPHGPGPGSGTAYQPTPTLTPESLFDSQAKLDAVRLQAFNRLLAAAHQKIKYASTQPSYGQMVYFDIPEWQPGCPRYDVKECVLYIAWNLRHAGFKVMYAGSNRLLISWKEQSIQYFQEESPIRQAMVAAANQGVKTAPPPPPSGKAEKKKASTYKPASEGVAGMLAQGGASRKTTSSTITFI
jgi:hypothetical protein